ncbi:hypothetical protein U0070_000003 [Myodes glareolus]|uniref:Large ribosomal subunit protein eL34 n=1 Tax=Myodes glareolus TaxID=447135 RepID=A0AAW0HVA1_MYOGA
MDLKLGALIHARQEFWLAVKLQAQPSTYNGQTNIPEAGVTLILTRGLVPRGTQNGPPADILRHGLSYNTASNKTRLSQTADNRIGSFYTKTVGQTPKSARDMCLDRPQEVHAVRPKVLARVSKTKKPISRASSGSTCARCVRQRIKGLSLSRSRKRLISPALALSPPTLSSRPQAISTASPPIQRAPARAPDVITSFSRCPPHVDSLPSVLQNLTTGRSAAPDHTSALSGSPPEPSESPQGHSARKSSSTLGAVSQSRSFPPPLVVPVQTRSFPRAVGCKRAMVGH